MEDRHSAPSMVLVDDGLKSKTIDGQDKPGKGKDEKSQGENPEADAGDKWHGAGGMAETYACSVNNNNEVRLLLAFSCSIPSRSPSASALRAPYFPASLFSPPSTSTTTRANLRSSIQHCSQRYGNVRPLHCARMTDPATFHMRTAASVTPTHIYSTARSRVDLLLTSPQLDSRHHSRPYLEGSCP